MINSEAYLEGTILYIDGRIHGEDFTPHEAAEYVADMQDMPGAPTGVRIFSRPRVRKARKQSKPGWPTELAPIFSHPNRVETGWPS